MYSFICDYSEGAHPRIMKALSELSHEQNGGYGIDTHCANAEKLIKKAIGRDDVDIHFMPMGTITNVVTIASSLRPYEAVLTAKTGHIEVHETGAIEATGHKIISLPQTDGKLLPEVIEKCVAEFEDEHTSIRKMVYISFPTESGTLYSLKELQALRTLCDKYDMYLYVDGARMGAGIMAEGNDVTLKDLSQLVDAFYIGATKNGALMGEALVLVTDELKPNFRFMVKRLGGLVAKGFMLGVQFEELFKDGLYFELADHANKMAQKLAKGIKELGHEFLSFSPTNQIFPIFTNKIIKELQKDYKFYTWEPVDKDHSVVRFVCSWATPEEEVDKFLEKLKRLSKSS